MNRSEFIRSVFKKVESGKPLTLAEARRLRNVDFERLCKVLDPRHRDNSAAGSLLEHAARILCGIQVDGAYPPLDTLSEISAAADIGTDDLKTPADLAAAWASLHRKDSTAYAVVLGGFFQNGGGLEPDVRPSLPAARRARMGTAALVAELFRTAGKIGRKGDEALIPHLPPVGSKDAEQAFFARLSRDSGATPKRKGRMPWKRLLRIIRDRLVKIVEHPEEKSPAKGRTKK
jgi:hypothetical protein